MIDASLVKPLLIALALAVLWGVESFLPMFETARPRWRHEASNLVLGGINALAAGALFAGLTLAITQLAAARGLGLLHWFSAPVWAETVLAVVLLDLWQYTWHRLNHRVPLLWRFHAVHHSDAAMSASTAVRFHTGEIVLSSVARLFVLPVLGLSIAQVLLYEALLLPVILFHHSNVRIAERMDRVLRVLIVTPRMHWVHHSELRPETDSNYSSVLSVWDRLFGSFRLRADPSGIRLGLGLARREWSTLRGMFWMPFRSSVLRNASGEPSESSVVRRETLQRSSPSRGR